MTKRSPVKSSCTAPSMSAPRSSRCTAASAEAGDARRFHPATWRASSSCSPTAACSTSTGVRHRGTLSSVRAGVALLLLPLLLASACSSKKAEQRARIERHFAVAKVFESAQPYTARTVAEADLDAFLAKAADYSADSASIAEFYHERHMQFAWILGDSISASAEAFIALAGVDDANAPGATKATRRLSALYNHGFADGKNVKLCDSCATELELRLTPEDY